MNFDKIKVTLKEIFVDLTTEDVEDTTDEETKIEPTTQTTFDIRMKMLRFVIGFAGMAFLLQALSPDMLTKVLYVIPEEGITFFSMLPIIILFYAVYSTCDMFGGFVINKCLLIYDNVINKVPIPTILHNMLVPIILCGYVVYKVYYPTFLTYISGVR